MGLVLKYGGTSVADLANIRAVASYIREVHATQPVVVVVSAMGKTTDQLLQMAKSLSNALSKRELDTLLATGEQQSIALLTMALHQLGTDAISLTGSQAGFLTTKSHTKGIITDVRIERVQQHLQEGKVVVVAGFQGITPDGDITTLGRGGSDTSAVALAAKLGFRCEIYTDVDGIYTVDPRHYPKAKRLSHLTYTECMEMSALGAGVIETRSVELAKKYNVELYIARSLSTQGSGTTIMNEDYMFEAKPITGLSITDNVVMITLKGIDNDNRRVAGIFQVVSDHNINLDMISQTIDQHNRLVLSFSIDGDDLEEWHQLQSGHENLFRGLDIETHDNLVKLSLIGVGMASHFGVAARVFETLADADIPFYHVSTSEISISVTVDNAHQNPAIHRLAEVFQL